MRKLPICSQRKLFITANFNPFSLLPQAASLASRDALVRAIYLSIFRENLSVLALLCKRAASCQWHVSEAKAGWQFLYN